jgi:aconitate hydratase 2/2-methylisocitrate dehydratase
MKGGPSIEVLLDLALGNDVAVAKIKFLKHKFLYDADTDRLEAAFKVIMK